MNPLRVDLDQHGTFTGTLVTLPEADWQWSLGPTFNIAFDQVGAPNVVQRWLLRALLGIYWRRL